MLRNVLLSTLLLLLAAAAATARQLPEPKLTPTPPTEKQSRLIREGIGLHEQGQFDAAIAKYEEALAENPSNTLALYEMGYAYSAKKDYKKSLEVAYRGAEYKSEQLSGFYLLVGNNLDLLGESQKAVEVYKRGIKLFPADALLHFNLAVTYKNLNKLDDSKKALKVGLQQNPRHASSHLLLALLFYNTGYRTPALFAAARFLELEPKSPRSAGAARIVAEVLRGGATPGKNPNEITLSLDLNAKKDEGDFGSVDMILGLSGALTLGEKGKGKTQAQLLVEQMETVLGLVAEGEEKKRQSTFVFKYYVPYFVELKQKGHVEAFVYHALQSSGLPGAREWVESNSGRVMQFLIWSKNYQWPTDLKL